MLDPRGEVGLLGLWLEGEEFPDDAEDVAVSAGGIEVEFLLV